MSDDRFKQARRSLIDKHNQRQQQSDDDDFGDDNTQLVDLHALESQVAQPAPSFAPPPNMNQSNSYGSSNSYESSADFNDEATAMFEVPADFSPGQHAQSGSFSSAPAYTPPSSQQPQYQQPPQNQPPSGYGQAPAYQPPAYQPPAYEPPAYQPPAYEPPAYQPPAASPQQPIGSHASQPFVPDEADGNTQFVNLNDFVNEAAHFTPEQQAAGYDGNTQFVDVASLMAGSDAHQPGSQAGIGPGDDIENDPILRQSYHYGPGSIQTGDVTLIFANNALGEGVVLKRVWHGPAHEMSTPLRQRIAQLNALKHPNLISMNGMIATGTGLWVELDHPGGARLTAVLQEQGPLPKETVMPWIHAVASVLAMAHTQQLAYANLTTDALWIQPDGSVRIEPFDMLRFEERGSLGDFGPQEMHRPVEQRQLSPATDIYSLAAVAVAALTGIPVQLGRVQSLEKSLKNPLTKALSNNPAERPQTAEAFAASLMNSSGFDLKQLDIKKVGAVAALLLVLFGGFMYWEAEEAKTKALAAQQVEQAALAKAQEREQLQQEQSQRRTKEATNIANSAGKGSPDQADSNELAADAPAKNPDQIALPGPVKIDPRLVIATSFQLNPPANNSKARTKSPTKAAEYREKAKGLMEEAKTMPDSRIQTTYREALETATEAILLDPENPENKELLEDLYKKDIVKEYMSDLRTNVESDVLQGNIASGRRHYRSLSTTDHNANALDFFESVKSAKVETVTRRNKAD